MNYTITIGEGLLILVGLAFFVFIIYCILLIKRLLPGMKALSKILEDTQTVTGLVSQATTETQEAVLNLTESATDISDYILSNQNTFKAIISLINAIVALKKLFSKK